MQEVKKSYNLTVTDTEKSMILRGLLLLENETRKIYETSFGIMAEDLTGLDRYFNDIQALRSYMMENLELVYDPSEEVPEPDFNAVCTPAADLEKMIAKTLSYLHYTVSMADTPDTITATEDRIVSLAQEYVRHAWGDDLSETEINHIENEAVNAYFRKR